MVPPLTRSGGQLSLSKYEPVDLIVSVLDVFEFTLIFGQPMTYQVKQNKNNINKLMYSI